VKAELTEFEPHVSHVLDPDERIKVRARAHDALVAVSDRRVIVADPRRVALAIPFERLRRIQFDIEKSRPATLVIVPEEAQDRPQVLAVPPDQYKETANALVWIGRRLAEFGKN
jgi:hypothetical protein